MENQKSGFIIINKPAGPTSHDMIYKLRKVTGIKKIGHAGTLDPFASGVLLCAIGREATRKISQFVKMDKEYIADIFLGATSDTMDRTGKINFQSTIFNLQLPFLKLNFSIKKLKLKQVQKVIKKFIGKQKQIPPMYSAKKVKGKKLYELARKGIKIKRKPVKINIYNIEILNYNFPRLKIKINCSSGTYIRSLAHDIGRKLKCGAYLEELERTAIGDFKIKNTIAVKNLNKNNWEEHLG